jgi:beta-glucosidase
MAGQDAGFPTPGIGMPANLALPHEAIDGRLPSSRAKLVQGAIEGHVLVKNTNNSLPLQSPKMISVFGGDDPYIGGTDVGNISAIAMNGTMYSGGGSGATSQSLVSSPMDALSNQCWDDDTEMFWDFTKNTPLIPASSDACIVMIK